MTTVACIVYIWMYILTLWPITKFADQQGIEAPLFFASIASLFWPVLLLIGALQLLFSRGRA